MNESRPDAVKGKDVTGIAVCFFCHDGKGNFLIQKRGMQVRTHAGTWDVGGGTIEYGELIEDALRREVQEEYGTEPLSHTLLGHREYVHATSGHRIMFDHLVLVDPTRVSIGEPDKVEEIRWSTLDDIPHPHFPQLDTAIAQWRDVLTSINAHA